MKIKELLSDESKWIKGYFAADKDGNILDDEYNERACKFCLLGALDKCYGTNANEYRRVRAKIESRIIPNETLGTIVRWNDAPERTFADVKQLVEELDI
jgi:hypothetical protein